MHASTGCYCTCYCASHSRRARRMIIVLYHSRQYTQRAHQSLTRALLLLLVMWPQGHNPPPARRGAAGRTSHGHAPPRKQQQARSRSDGTSGTVYCTVVRLLAVASTASHSCTTHRRPRARALGAAAWLLYYRRPRRGFARRPRVAPAPALRARRSGWLILLAAAWLSSLHHHGCMMMAGSAMLGVTIILLAASIGGG